MKERYPLSSFVTGTHRADSHLGERPEPGVVLSGAEDVGMTICPNCLARMGLPALPALGAVRWVASTLESSRRAHRGAEVVDAGGVRFLQGVLGVLVTDMQKVKWDGVLPEKCRRTTWLSLECPYTSNSWAFNKTER